MLSRSGLRVGSEFIPWRDVHGLSAREHTQRWARMPQSTYPVISIYSKERRFDVRVDDNRQHPGAIWQHLHTARDESRQRRRDARQARGPSAGRPGQIKG